jgi:hypothetical protein
LFLGKQFIVQTLNVISKLFRLIFDFGRTLPFSRFYGEAAGSAVTISLKHNIAVRAVNRVELQTNLLKNGANLRQRFRRIPGLADKYAPKEKREYLS